MFRVSPVILMAFYSGAVESVWTQNITLWFGNIKGLQSDLVQQISSTNSAGCLHQEMKDQSYRYHQGLHLVHLVQSQDTIRVQMNSFVLMGKNVLGQRMACSIKVSYIRSEQQVGCSGGTDFRNIITFFLEDCGLLLNVFTLYYPECLPSKCF